MELVLEPEMFTELIAAARECQCSPRQFAIDCVDSVLASRRLPRMDTPGGYGGRHYPAKAGQHEVEPELILVEHDFLFPDKEM